MSWESTAAARRALHRFLDASLEADDLVAIIRASAGGAPLQQSTRDREQLHRAVERIQWTVASRSGVSAFSAVANPNMPTPAGPEPEAATDIRNVYYTMGSLGALEFIARGLEGRPGRKAVVYMSEGMDLFQDREQGGPLWSRFIRLLDRANRAGLVV
jgi:hypothetical protein